MAVEPITMVGFKEFRKSLKEVNADLPKAVRVAFNESAQLVVDAAQPKITTKSGRARGSVRVASTQTKAQVKGGGSKASYYPWLDFGGRTGAHGNAHRPFIGDGRYMYKAYFGLRDSGDFDEVVAGSLKEIAEAAGWTVNGG